MDCRGYYDMLSDMGDLLEMFPYLSGDWQKDQKAFEKICEQNQEIGII